MTDEGKRHIMRYLAGQVDYIGGSIALGTGEAPAAISDSRLTYEFDRANIYLTSPDYNKNLIVFKGTIEESTIGTIKEVGLYSTEFGSTAAGSPSRTLVSFERNLETWETPSFASGNHRVGFEALRVSPSANGTLTNTLSSANIDLSQYSNNDQLSIAYHSLDSNTSSIRLRFRGIDPTTYYEYVISNPSLGYNVMSFNKSAMTKTGILDFSSIDSIQVAVAATASGPAQVDFDGIRIETSSPDVDNVLISRSVLAQPIVKNRYGLMDIEYALEVTL